MAEVANRARVAVLLGPKQHHRHTLATLIASGVNVVGVVIANMDTLGLPLWYLRMSTLRRGLIPTLSRTAARLLYLCFNHTRDRKLYSEIFDPQFIEPCLANWQGEVLMTTRRYHDPETLDWLRALKPDLLVAHTGYWVDKKVRELPASGFTIGGHPGITPGYRGSHSAFWAIYQGCPQEVGCTAFILDAGVDTGPILAQDRIEIEDEDSFRSLGWKGMARIAELQAELVSRYEETGSLDGRLLEPPPDSEFFNPTLREYITYLMRSEGVR